MSLPALDPRSVPHRVPLNMTRTSSQPQFAIKSNKEKSLEVLAYQVEKLRSENKLIRQEIQQLYKLYLAQRSQMKIMYDVLGLIMKTPNNFWRHR